MRDGDSCEADARCFAGMTRTLRPGQVGVNAAPNTVPVASTVAVLLTPTG